MSDNTLNGIGNGIAAIAASVIGLAALALIVSQRANSAGIIGSLGSAFSGVIGAAVAPVTGGGAVSSIGTGGNTISQIGSAVLPSLNSAGLLSSIPGISTQGYSSGSSDIFSGAGSSDGGW